MKKNSALLLFVCTLILWARPVQSEWQTFGTGDGLSASYVLAMIEDRSGNFWFGTESGIVDRYDGVSWTSYPLPGDAIHRVNSIVEDRNGNLWFGTEGSGAVRYDGASWTVYTSADGLAGNDIKEMFEDRSGALWFATYGDGVSRYDGTGWVTYTMADGLADDDVYEIMEDSAGNLWFGTYGGVNLYDGETWITYTTADGLAHDHVFAIVEDHSGHLWFGTEIGSISEYDGRTWRTYDEEDGVTGDEIEAMLVDRRGHLWVATDGGGLNRFDGQRWRTYTTEEGLVSNSVHAIVEDDSGGLWFGTYGGASRYDGVSWTTYREADGLGSDDVRALLKHSSGDVWVGTAWTGVSRFDGLHWTGYSTPGDVQAMVEDRSGNLWVGTWDNGVSRYGGGHWTSYLPHRDIYSLAVDHAGNLWCGTQMAMIRYDGLDWTWLDLPAEMLRPWGPWVTAIREDSSGNLWCGTHDGGVGRFDGVNWETYSAAEGPEADRVYAIIEDRSGNLWFGTYGSGVALYDGSSWVHYRTSDGLAHDHVFAVFEDRDGALWFGTEGGLSRYDGSTWVSYSTADGLADNGVVAITQDDLGDMWIGTWAGVSVFEMDRVAPQTLIWPRLPALRADRGLLAAFTCGFKDSDCSFSTSLDGGVWSDWSNQNVWVGDALADGEHALRVKARDKTGNVDPTPAVYAFEIDAIPPAAVLSFPTFSQPVRDSIRIMGSAADARFAGYRLELRPSGATSWEAPEAKILAAAARQVTDGELATWDTRSAEDGAYEMRLAVTDTLGLTGITVVELVVDNEAPWASETSPVRIRTAQGGSVYTTEWEARCYFPPRAFAEDVVVTIAVNSDASVPDTLENGSWRIHPGCTVAWGGLTLRKAGTLDLSLQNLDAGHSFERAVVYWEDPASGWRRMGGTLDRRAQAISTSMEHEGRYAVFAEPDAAAGQCSLTALAATPRAFSPSGGFADTQTAISFKLGSASPVTVQVYNRAGRLVKELASGRTMNAGVNLVRWDGRDRAGGIVPDGLYFVVAEALQEKQTVAVAVVR